MSRGKGREIRTGSLHMPIHMGVGWGRSMDYATPRRYRFWCVFDAVLALVWRSLCCSNRCWRSFVGDIVGGCILVHRVHVALLEDAAIQERMAAIPTRLDGFCLRLFPCFVC